MTNIETEQFDALLGQIANTLATCDNAIERLLEDRSKYPNQEVCQMRLQQLEIKMKEHDRTLKGSNGKHSGLHGRIEKMEQHQCDFEILFNERMDGLEKSQTNTNRILTGIAIGIIMAVVGIVINGLVV